MPIDPEQFERLRSEVDENLRKLEDENEKFQELMADRRPEDGPWNWRHTENVADRLHNFYRGVEQILKRIVKEIDGGTPDGKHWHKDLLRQVSSSTADRPAVFNDELRVKLLELLQFRHFYRESYFIDLEWDSMTSLVDDFEDVFEGTQQSIEAFMSDIEP